jgi:formylglycine-generating enzyme required for sulfatase activity
MSRLLRGGLLAGTVAVLALFVLRPGHAQTAKGKKYALLVGVDYYAHSGFKPLDGAENDVVELEKVLKKQGFLTRLLTTARGRNKGAEAPTAANLRRELDALLDDKTREDTVLIAFAGHGAEVKVPDPDDKDKEEPRTKSYTYFIPTDGNLQKISYSTGQSDRLIELGELFDRLGAGPKKCGAGAKLVLIDACRNGVTAESSTRSAALSPTHVKVPDGVSALFSCGPGQMSLELSFDVGGEDTRKHGVFFYHVIEGLKGKAVNRGKINWSDLTSYVQDEVPGYLQRLKLRTRQNPHAVMNSPLPVLLVDKVEGTVVEEGKKETPGKSKVVVAGKPVVSSIGMRRVPIPAGKFLMGSPAGEKDRSDNEGPQHEVEITRGFHLGEKEVTQGQFKAVMGYNPSYFSKDGKGKKGLKYSDLSTPAGGKDKVSGGTEDYPVENVSHDEAVEFCRKITEKDRKEGKIGRELKYRLPTEAEWEYSCRGGAPSYKVFHFGHSLSSRQANFDGNYPYGGAEKGPYLGRTCKVGSYEKNGYGLYDMHGNVWEWCADCYVEDYYYYKIGPATGPWRDPLGPYKGSDRVLRGGSWYDDGRNCRSAVRYWFAPEDRSRHYGFRVALVPSGD